MTSPETQPAPVKKRPVATHKKFNRWLKAKRGRAKWLAMDLEISASYISRVCCGRIKPNAAVKDGIEKHCGIPVEAWEEGASA